MMNGITSKVLFSDPRFDEAQALAAAGDAAAALVLYARIGADQSERHRQDALALEKRGDVAGAIASLKKAVAADPGNYGAWMSLAGQVSGGETEKALRGALAAQPADLTAGTTLAQLLMREKRLAEAAGVLDALLPNDDVRFILAHIHWQLGDFPATERHLRRYIAARPADIRAYDTLIDLYNRDDRLGEAEALCREYIAANGLNESIGLALVRVLVRACRWADAEAALTELVNAAPDALAPWQAFGELLEKSGRREEAGAVLEKNVEVAPGALDAYLQLADFYYRGGDKPGAEASCRAAAGVLAGAGNWGLATLPQSLDSRLIFYRLEEIAARYCTGTRALVDLTGLDLAQVRDFGEVVELFCMVSGQEHVDYLEYASFPALAASEGFDRLLRERTVVYNIYTTSADYPALQGFLGKLAARGIRYRVNVELLGVSQDLYAILSLPIIDQVRRSLAMQSVVVMSLPDAIISGSIHRVIGDMQPRESVVCAMPRIDSERAYPWLKERFSGGQAAPLGAREFVRRAMNDFRHPQTRAALTNDSPCLRYRDAGGYYAAHNWAPPPLCFHAREEMLAHMMRNPLCGPNAVASFYTVDHDFVDSAWRGGNLRLIGDSDYFFWAELTGPNRHGDFLAGRKAEDYYYPESARAVFAHEFKWIYGDRPA